MKLYDALAANTFVVRLFAHERGNLEFDVEPIAIETLDNRKPYYKNNVNARGELPALRLDDGSVITEVTAICEYWDEVATGGQSLFGKNAQERAETRMWLRRMDLELAQPIIAWFRNDPETVDFYRGTRIPCPEARLTQKILINQFLNLLDDELEGKTWLCGDRFSAADIHFYGEVKLMTMGPAPWILLPARKNVVAYFERMDKRKAVQAAMTPFAEGKVSL